MPFRGLRHCAHYLQWCGFAEISLVQSHDKFKANLVAHLVLALKMTDKFKEEEEEEEEEEERMHPKRIKTIACFFTLGLLAMLYKQILGVAAQDILSGSHIPSSTVIFVGALPGFSVKLTLPWFVQRWSYFTRTIAVVLLQIGGLLTIALSSMAHWRLAGVAVVFAGFGLGEITFLALTSFYEDVTGSAIAAGLGMASLLGPFYYTGQYKIIAAEPSARNHS